MAVLTFNLREDYVFVGGFVGYKITRREEIYRGLCGTKNKK